MSVIFQWSRLGKKKKISGGKTLAEACKRRKAFPLFLAGEGPRAAGSPQPVPGHRSGPRAHAGGHQHRWVTAGGGGWVLGSVEMNSFLSQNTLGRRDGSKGNGEGGLNISGEGAGEPLKHLTRCQTETVNTVSAAEVDGGKKTKTKKTHYSRKTTLGRKKKKKI